MLKGFQKNDQSARACLGKQADEDRVYRKFGGCPAVLHYRKCWKSQGAIPEQIQQGA